MPRENLTQLIRRVERLFEQSIQMVTVDRGYSIQRGVWDGKIERKCCAIGAVTIAFAAPLSGGWINIASDLLDVEPRDLDYFVDGFDDGTDPPPRNKPRNRQFYLLGRRLARRHVYA